MDYLLIILGAAAFIIMIATIAMISWHLFKRYILTKLAKFLLELTIIDVKDQLDTFREEIEKSKDSYDISKVEMMMEEMEKVYNDITREMNSCPLNDLEEVKEYIKRFDRLTDEVIDLIENLDNILEKKTA